jgi:hypothetical protein
MYDFKNGIVVTNSKIPKMLSWFISIRAITLWPWIIFRDDADEVTINHERIHIRQQAELLVIPFYVLYAGFWLFYKLKGQTNSEAYMNIPFEKEAYANDEDRVYLLNRKWFSWKKYI